MKLQRQNHSTPEKDIYIYIATPWPLDFELGFSFLLLVATGVYPFHNIFYVLLVLPFNSQYQNANSVFLLLCTSHGTKSILCDRIINCFGTSKVYLFLYGLL